MTATKDERRHAMRKLTALIVVAAAAATLASRAVATDPGHFRGQFTFADTMCGSTGTTTWSVNDNYGAKADGSSWDAGFLTQTFIADNGRGVLLSYDAGREYNAPAVTSADGTTTLVFVYSGLNLKTQALDGPMLQQTPAGSR
jgi:hypothetical protein